MSQTTVELVTWPRLGLAPEVATAAFSSIEGASSPLLCGRQRRYTRTSARVHATDILGKTGAGFHAHTREEAYPGASEYPSAARRR